MYKKINFNLIYLINKLYYSININGCFLIKIIQWLFTSYEILDLEQDNWITILFSNFFENCRIHNINYTKNLSNKLSAYEIVCGPLGVTTFETILSKTLPVTISIYKDKYYNLSDWIKLNHLMHLNFYEKKNIYLYLNYICCLVITLFSVGIGCKYSKRSV